MNATPLANNSMPRCEGEEMTGYDPFRWDLSLTKALSEMTPLRLFPQPVKAATPDSAIEDSNIRLGGGVREFKVKTPTR